MVEVEGAFDVLLAHGREDQGADDGESNLAAVRVAGEHEVDEGKAGVLDDVVCEVGFVAHEQDGGLRISGDGHGEVRCAGAGVICTGEPEEVAAAFEGVVAVNEDGCAVGFKGRDDATGADDDVVIAEDAETLGFDGGEDLRADTGGLVGDGHLTGAAADVVPSDEDEVGVEAVDLGDDALEEIGFGELFEVDVGDLDDAEIHKAVGEIADGDGEARDVELVTGVGAGVGGETDAGRSGARHECPARDGSFWLTDAAVFAEHSP